MHRKDPVPRNPTEIMLSDDIRARLRRLHRSHVGAAPRAAPASTPRRGDAPGYRPGDWLSLGRQIENDSGKHLQLCQPLADYWPQASQAVAHTASAIIASQSGRLKRGSHDELTALAEHFPSRSLFLDLETCGFAGSTVFLVGMVRESDGALVLDQLLARDYGEERAVLETLWQTVEKHQVLVTFNGKSFDWPMVRDRSTRHRLEQSGRDKARESGTKGCLGRNDLVHCDLLHHARRRWKRLLPNCRLQTLERYVCNRWRRNDLPGDQVPAAYHEFVRSGHTEKIGPILHHNRLDLVTLVQIGLRLASA